MEILDKCFICGGDAKIAQDLMNYFVECPRCGNHHITKTLSAYNLNKRKDAYLISAILRGASEANNPIKLHIANLDSLLKNTIYPTDPLAAIDELLLIVYSRTESMDSFVQFNPELDYPLLFSKSPKEFRYVVAKAIGLGYLKKIADNLIVQLELQGWERALALRTHVRSNHKIAFMAMQFNDPNLDHIYNDFIKPAIKQTGFQLRRVDERQPAGLIDARLRVDINNSRFLIAELTHQNRGVYWESGYAEGLGKPVIYLCHKNPDEEIENHFDTNHHTTVFWNENNLIDAMDKLKSTVRATFPTESQQEDSIE